MSHTISLILYPHFSLAGILGSNNWPFPHLPHPLPAGTSAKRTNGLRKSLLENKNRPLALIQAKTRQKPHSLTLNLHPENRLFWFSP